MRHFSFKAKFFILILLFLLVLPAAFSVSSVKDRNFAVTQGFKDISLVGRAFEFSREAPNEFGWLLASVLAIVFVFVFITVIVYRKKK
ncbi:hypothetical protein DRJ25_04925 [Candidatus Woesearchaeota archaeon]|nr:MAG: hypothetical protein DRJ25_04925 [Candidatus Woesearchaeota archaeon]